MNVFKTLLITFALSLTMVGIVSAAGDTNCTPIYGGGATCASTGLVIDKKVKHPQNNDFVDNLSVNDPKYTPEQGITFRIAVTNTGTVELKPVTIVDTLPAHLTGITSDGTHNADNNTVTYTIGVLKPGETKTVELNAATAAQNDLPANQGNTCVTNIARAHTENLASEDTASYCIQVLNGVPTTEGGLPVYPEPQVTSTPKTGPEALALAALLPGVITGYLLRKRSK
jgi:uncharacterized repeat protein (TIGR01451 family)